MRKTYQADGQQVVLAKLMPNSRHAEYIEAQQDSSSESRGPYNRERCSVNLVVVEALGWDACQRLRSLPRDNYRHCVR